MQTSPAPTKRSATKTIHAALRMIQKNGGSMPRKAIIEQLQQELEFEEWEIERYESNGQLRWLTIFLFYTVNCIKAGWLVKNKGIWSITPEGEKALKLTPEKLLDESSRAYRAWNATQDGTFIVTEPTTEYELDFQSKAAQEVSLLQYQTQADEGIRQFLLEMKEYDFQHLCALLLKSMGYHINFESAPGKDGGIDIIAFKDSLGFEKPRIKVQCKRYHDGHKVDVKPIREFKGLLHKGEDIGIFITSSFFTREAQDFARNADVHIKLIDRNELVTLWIGHSSGLEQEERNLLPLVPVYFLGKNE